MRAPGMGTSTPRAPGRGCRWAHPGAQRPAGSQRSRGGSGGGVFASLLRRAGPPPSLPGTFVSPRRRRRGRAGSEGRRLALHKSRGAAGDARGRAGTGECRAPGSGTFWVPAPSSELRGGGLVAAETSSPGELGGLQKLVTVMMVMIIVMEMLAGLKHPGFCSWPTGC